MHVGNYNLDVMKKLFIQSLFLFKKGFLHKKNTIICPANKFVITFFIKLIKLGYLNNISFCTDALRTNKQYIKIFYKYNQLGYSFNNIIIFSTESRHYYKTYLQILILKKQFNIGLLLFSTSKGILTDLEIIREKIGGFLICYIY
jgi:ribosomal protein S8